MSMFYVKNVPGWERAARVLAGLAMLAASAVALGATPLGFVVGASGVVALLTGFVGFCPMCALVGRRLDASP